MAVGWARDGAVQDQIDASLADAVELARSRLPAGESLTHCETCGGAIPLARREAIAGVRLCVTCQSRFEAQGAGGEAANARREEGGALG